MARTIRVVLDPASIDKAIDRLNRYRASLQRKGNDICKRLSAIGQLRASLGYEYVAYDGEKDVKVTVETIPNGFAVVANGATVLILEFGAGVTYGYGHPQAEQFGMGPGTYPGQRYAMDPRGWNLPKSAGGGHTYGNHPSMAMYFAAEEMRREVERVAREVFGK